MAKEHVSCQALPEHFKNKKITRALLLARGTLCITPVEMLFAFLPQINTLLKMQSGKGRQPGKATTGTCNPPPAPPSHLRGSGCAAPHFRQQILLVLVSSFGIYTWVFEIHQQKLSGVVSVENVPVSKPHFTDFSL